MTFLKAQRDPEINIMSHLVGIGLVIGFLLPHTSSVLLLVNPILCIFYQCFKCNRSWFQENLIVIIPILITIIINFNQDISSKSLQSCFTIILYFICFPMVSNIKIPNYFFYIILIFILVSQLIYVLKIPFLENLLDTYYPYSDEDAQGYQYIKNRITWGDISNYRLGGIYRNSNQCARYITFLLTTFLILNKTKAIRKTLPFIAICSYGVLLTGSRTGFVVTAIIIIAYVFSSEKTSQIFKYSTVLLLLTAFVIFVQTQSDVYRGANLADTGSSAAKSETFLSYLSSENSIHRLLFGYLDPTRYKDMADLNVMAAFDSEYGAYTFKFGFVGALSILLYFYLLYRKTDKNSRIFYLLMTWMITSTIISSYRALFLFMLLLSLVYNQHKLSEKEDASNNLQISSSL